jgi:molecular chaperone DnaJ
MGKRDLYAVLGISEDAGPAEIKQAYRRLAFTHHPDVGPMPDAERFREIHEAYEILSDPEQRRAYDMSTGRRAALLAEPLRVDPVNIGRNRPRPHPGTEPLFGQILHSFAGYRPKIGRPGRRLGIEAILEPEEARFGCQLPIRLPFYAECRACNSLGHAWGWYACPNCGGRGIVETIGHVTIQIPAGVRDGNRYEFYLGGTALGNLVLDVKIVVR